MQINSAFSEKHAFNKEFPLESFADDFLKNLQ